MEAIEVFRAHLLRSDVNQSWGFQLQGGAEVDQPLKISKIAAGSSAEATGLRVEDVVVEVNGTSTLHLSHSQVIETLRQLTGDQLLLTVERKKSKPLGKESESDVTAIESTEDKKQSKPKEVKSVKEIRFEEDPDTLRAGVPSESHSAASGPRSQPQRYSSGPQMTPFQFQTVQSRPFVEPASRHGRRPNPPSATPPRQFYPPPPLASQDLESPSAEYYTSAEYSPYLHDEVHSGEVPQSRTFRQLQSVMSNEEPGAGVDGLPPPKSASLERMKSEGGGAGSSPRVKVIMSQKYNSPLGIYSANNAIETFAIQAESVIETLEKQQKQSIGPECHPVFSSTMQQ